MLENTHLCVVVGGNGEERGESYGVVPSGKGGETEINFHYGILKIQIGEHGKKNLETQITNFSQQENMYSQDLWTVFSFHQGTTIFILLSLQGMNTHHPG